MHGSLEVLRTQYGGFLALIVIGGLAGWIAGILLTFGANWAINHFVRASLQSVITPDWWPRACAIALVASLLGAIYPGLRAARQDAIEALSYE